MADAPRAGGDSTSDHDHDEEHDDRLPVVGVGASAGGLDAFTELLKALPTDGGMAYVLVCHLDRSHQSMMAGILSRVTAMPVTEVTDGTTVMPDHVYVIPPDRHMVISGNTLRLVPRDDAADRRRPIDVFLRSLAEERDHRAIGVILSGTADDGTRGLEWIKLHGGITFAQDDSARHEGMPRSAVASGFVDYVLPPGQIAGELARIAKHSYLDRLAASGAPHAPPRDGEGPDLLEMLEIVREATGVDFAHYKNSTIRRRIARRMLLHRIDDPRKYQRLLRDTPAEVRALHDDVLIHVTRFFRDPDAYTALGERVLPLVTADRHAHDPLRVWVVGCSSGEEAYSIAMRFAEFADAGQVKAPLQLFATDLSEEAVGRARAGLYPATIAEDVSPGRLEQFFVEVEGNYRIARRIRDMCVFARHDVLSDPPFSHMDLISCRNLLIYLDPVLQKRLIPVLHYSLRPGGVLWLGNSETVGTHKESFEILDP